METLKDKLIASLVFWSACLAFTVVAEPKVFCVFGSWAAQQSGAGRFTIKDIRPELCDYVVYAYAELSPGGGLIVSSDPEQDLDSVSGSYAQLRRVKWAHPGLRTLIGIGGHKVTASKFSRVSSVPRIREGLAIGAAEFARHHGFDGVALAWYYPGQSDANDRSNLSHLIKVMGQRLHNYGLEMAVFVSPIEEEMERGYIMEDIGKLSDWVFPLTFDYHGPWESRVRHFAPLHGEANTSVSVSVESTLTLLKHRKVPNDKIVLGIGTYGRSYTLEDPDKHRIGDVASGPGNPGPITKEAGFLGYNEICEDLLMSPVVHETTHRTVEGPYTYFSDQWISFEDDRSVRRKTEFARKRKLGGVMLWTLDTDDVRNHCRMGAFPLHVAVNQALGRNVSRIYDP